ncbi:MAG: LysE family transporter [Alphaproteobacteria bacterium]|nr:LysE family transporter [Alphaproteobacteria bacterium]
MLSALISLWLAAIPLMASPGPAVLGVSAMATAYGLRATIPYWLGIVFGTVTVLLVVVLGITSVFFAVPGVKPALVVLAVIYILYLAFRIATAPVAQLKRETGKPPEFAAGFIIAVANPKAFAVFGALCASHSIMPDQPVLDGALKFIALLIMAAIASGAWLLFGSLLAKYLQNPLLSRVVNICFALLLVLSVLKALSSFF